MQCGAEAFGNRAAVEPFQLDFSPSFRKRKSSNGICIWLVDS